MATVARLTVSNAKQVDPVNWVTILDVTGPKEIPDPSPRGDCIVQADTAPQNNPAEWAQIVWSGGEPVPGKPNQRLVSRQAVGTTKVSASLGGGAQNVVIWTMWADVAILTKGARPPQAKPWTAGTPFAGPDQCGAFEVGAMTMGKDARGQIVAVATLLPAGVGKVIAKAGMSNLLNFRRELTAADFTEGTAFKNQKSFHPWVDDTFTGMQSLSAVDADAVYDTDGPDLPSAVHTAETYNNFRQWLQWDGSPCSNYGYWYFRARWKEKNVTLKDVGTGSITLPNKPFCKP